MMGYAMTMTRRILILFGMIAIFELQIIVLDFFCKPIQADLDINPLHGVSAIGFVLSWTTGVSANTGLLLAFFSLLVLPVLFLCLHNGLLYRAKSRQEEAR